MLALKRPLCWVASINLLKKFFFFPSGWQQGKRILNLCPGKKFKRRKVKRIKRRTAPYIYFTSVLTVYSHVHQSFFSSDEMIYVQWSSSYVHSCWITFEIRKKKKVIFYYYYFTWELLRNKRKMGSLKLLGDLYNISSERDLKISRDLLYIYIY